MYSRTNVYICDPTRVTTYTCSGTAQLEQKACAELKAKDMQYLIARLEQRSKAFLGVGC